MRGVKKILTDGPTSHKRLIELRAIARARPWISRIKLTRSMMSFVCTRPALRH